MRKTSRDVIQLLTDNGINAEEAKFAINEFDLASRRLYCFQELNAYPAVLYRTLASVLFRLLVWPIYIEQYITINTLLIDFFCQFIIAVCADMVTYLHSSFYDLTAPMLVCEDHTLYKYVKDNIDNDEQAEDLLTQIKKVTKTLQTHGLKEVKSQLLTRAAASAHVLFCRGISRPGNMAVHQIIAQPLSYFWQRKAVPGSKYETKPRDAIVKLALT